MDLNYSFRVQKDFNDMEHNVKCYWETDDDEIALAMQTRFKNSTAITVMRTSFFQSFIDGMSTLYQNQFTRVANLPPELEQELNYRQQDVERYLHLSRESAMYLKSQSEMNALDASQYWVDDSTRAQVRVYLKNELNSSVLCFVENDAIYEKVGVELKTVAGSYKGKAIEEIRQTWKKVSALGDLPFCFIRYPKLPKPMLNPLVALQTNFIVSMSWGYYNIDPKLLTQFSVTSDSPADEVQKAIGNLGRTSKALLLGQGSTVSVIDTGDLKPLLDALTAYNTLIKQRALQCGVDFSLVDISGTAAQASGESKRIERAYINQKRKKWFREFENFEQRLIAQYNKVFKTNYVINAVTFNDIPLSLEETTATTTNNVVEETPQE